MIALPTPRWTSLLPAILRSSLIRFMVDVVRLVVIWVMVGVPVWVVGLVGYCGWRVWG